eukprot:g66882.t1
MQCRNTKRKRRGGLHRGLGRSVSDFIVDCQNILTSGRVVSDPTHDLLSVEPWVKDTRRGKIPQAGSEDSLAGRLDQRFSLVPDLTDPTPPETTRRAMIPL